MSSNLFLAVVDKGKADGLMRSAKKAGSRGGTILTARAIASNSLLCLLGLGDSRKEILLTLVDEAERQSVWDGLVNSKHFRGMAASFVASWEGPVDTQVVDQEWNLLAVICNNGLGDDILSAVRKIQPVGGLIVDGRGTAQLGDIPFFWAHLVPEKELVLAFVPATSTDAILQAVDKLKSLQAQGSGIAFTLPVVDIAVKKHKTSSVS